MALMKKAGEKIKALGITVINEEIANILAEHLHVSPTRVWAWKETESQKQKRAVAPPSTKPHTDVYFKLIDSYRALFCRQCMVYDCNLHASSRVLPPLAIQQQKALHKRDMAFEPPKPDAMPCSDACHRNVGDPDSMDELEVNEELHAIIKKAFEISLGNYCVMKDIVGDLSCRQIAIYCNEHGMVAKDLHTVAFDRAEKSRKKYQKKRMYSSVFTKRGTFPVTHRMKWAGLFGRYPFNLEAYG